jgi:hypothetical protein
VLVRFQVDIECGALDLLVDPVEMPGHVEQLMDVRDL